MAFITTEDNEQVSEVLDEKINFNNLMDIIAFHYAVATDFGILNTHIEKKEKEVHFSSSYEDFILTPNNVKEITVNEDGTIFIEILGGDDLRLTMLSVSPLKISK